MKILKIEDNKGYFFCESTADWKPIDQIDKDSLMRLLDAFIEKEVSMDAFDEDLIQNQAQQIIYKSIYEKFSNLAENKNKFVDESERTYLAALQKYQVADVTSE